MADIRLVLLPGLDGSGVLFRPLLGHLPIEFTPIVLTYPPDRPDGYDGLLPQVLAALPVEGRYALLGESFSGPLALMAAARRPPGLAGVILCASFVRNPVWSRPQWLAHLARPVAFRLYPTVTWAVRSLMGRSTATLRAMAAEALEEVRPEVLAARVRAVLRVDVTRELRQCAVPILYLKGNRDWVVRGHNAAEIVAACPGTQVACFPAPHMVLQTQPAAAAAAIMAFVRELAHRPEGQQTRSPTDDPTNRADTPQS